jgi:NagD protein
MVRLNNFGVKVNEGEVYTSGVAAAEYLLEKYGKAKLCVIASESYKKELASFGFTFTNEDPDLVLVAFDLNMTYSDIYQVCRWIRSGKPYYATHPDTNCPNEEAPLPDVGSLIEMIATSTGRYPDLVCGKPNAPILEGVMRRLDAKREETAMVGDRLSTDILFGVKNGITSVCVMTGDTTYEMLEDSKIKPDYVLENFAQFLTILK